MKSKIDKSILIEIEVASPLHIGAAAEQHWQEGIDFFVHDGNTYVVSLDNLSEEIEAQELSSLLLNRSTNAILNRIKSKLGSLAYKVFKTKASSEIKRLTFSAMEGKPYLPGSSLKGAIRSILLTHFFKEANLSKNEYNEQKLIGGFENSVMRFLQFADVPFQESLVVNSKIFNLQRSKEGGWKNGNNTDQNLIENAFNTFYECFNVGSIGFTTISYRSEQAGNLINASKNHGSKVIPPPRATLPFLTNFSFDNFFKIINDHTIRYLEKEIAFFDEYKFDEASNAMLESLVDLKQQAGRLDDTQACMLRMSAGSGFHSITGDWQYDDFIKTGTHTGGKDQGKQKYKSRKVSLYNRNGLKRVEPLGFIILRKTDPEAILAKQLETEVLKAEQAEKQQVANVEAKRLEAERIEAERLVAEEAKKPKMSDAPPTNGLEVDAVVTQSDKPTKVNIFLKGYEKKYIIMSECGALPIGYVCRVKLVVKKKNIERVIHLAPKS